MAIISSDTATPGDIDRDWEDCYEDKLTKNRKYACDKLVVSMQEKMLECVDEQSKTIVATEIAKVSRDATTYSNLYFDRTNIRLPPLQDWELRTPKMKAALNASAREKRTTEDALLKAACDAMSHAVVSM
jgi:hypothetical protein